MKSRPSSSTTVLVSKPMYGARAVTSPSLDSESVWTHIPVVTLSFHEVRHQDDEDLKSEMNHMISWARSPCKKDQGIKMIMHPIRQAGRQAGNQPASLLCVCAGAAAADHKVERVGDLLHVVFAQYCIRSSSINWSLDGQPRWWMKVTYWWTHSHSFIECRPAVVVPIYVCAMIWLILGTLPSQILLTSSRLNKYVQSENNIWMRIFHRQI